MPQTTEQLRSKFMVKADPDGIETCEQIISNAGGKVNKGTITYVGNDEQVMDAIKFLIEEWDYSLA